MKKFIVLGLAFGFFYASSVAYAAASAPVVVEGTIEHLHEDNFSLKTVRDRFFIRTSEGKKFELKTRTPLSHSKKVRLRGVALQDTLTLDESAGVEVLGTAPTSMLNTPGQERVAVVLLNFPDLPTSTITPTDVSNLMNGVDGYYNEVSYGKRRVYSDIFGWYTSTKPFSQVGCDLAPIIQEAINVSDADADFRVYTHVVAFVPTIVCPWVGAAFVGTGPLFLTNEGSFNFAVNAFATNYAGVEEHELGHNFGVYHANFLNCGTVSLRPDPFINGCSNHEYGDEFDVMGNAYRIGHMSAVHKNALGFFDPAQVENVSASGTFSLEPLETVGSGIKALSLQRSDGTRLFVEYREPLGRDSIFGAPALNGAFIHVNYFAGTGDAFLIDGTPSSPSSREDSVYKVGQTFTDPLSSISITPTAQSAGSLTVRVDFPAPQPQNLLSNGGFESGTLPWNGFSSDEALVTDVLFDGTRSLRFYDGCCAARNIYQSVNASAGSTYSLSGYIKTSAIDTGQTANMAVAWINSSGGTIRRDVVNIVSSNQVWTQSTEFIAAPAGTTRALINLELQPTKNGSNDGVAWFDNIVFSVDSTPPPPPPPPPPPSGNLLANNGFEADKNSWLGWGSDEAVVTNVKFAGTRALRFFDGCCSIRSIYQEVPASPGVSYTVSAAIKTSSIASGQVARMVVEWRNTSGSIVQKDTLNQVTASQDWNTSSVATTAPANTSKARVYLELTGSKPNSGTAWFDEVVFGS